MFWHLTNHTYIFVIYYVPFHSWGIFLYSCIIIFQYLYVFSATMFSFSLTKTMSKKIINFLYSIFIRVTFLCMYSDTNKICIYSYQTGCLLITVLLFCFSFYCILSFCKYFLNVIYYTEYFNLQTGILLIKNFVCKLWTWRDKFIHLA